MAGESSQFGRSDCGVTMDICDIHGTELIWYECQKCGGDGHPDDGDDDEVCWACDGEGGIWLCDECELEGYYSTEEDLYK